MRKPRWQVSHFRLSVMAFIKSWQFDSLSKTNTHPYPTCLLQPALVVFYFCLFRLIAYEAINLVLAFSFILCTIIICPTQAWEAGPCRQTFSLSCNSPPPPLPTPLLHKQSPNPPIKIKSKANQNQSTFFDSGQGGSLPRRRFLDVTQRSPTQRCVTSKNQLRGRLAGR